ncbi:MAG: ABC transporter, partial [Pseudomonadota bacterium]
AHRPSFVIADEPTAALDPENAVKALSLLMDAAQNGEAAVIVSSHDVTLLDRFATRRVMLDLSPSEIPNSVHSVLSELEAVG